MPRLIAKNRIVAFDTESLVVDDAHAGAYGFCVHLADQADPDWTAEFQDAYRRLPHPVQPPVEISGNQMTVFFLPRYQDELPSFLAHLLDVAAEANRQVDARNAVLPDDHDQRSRFQDALRSAVASLNGRTPKDYTQ